MSTSLPQPSTSSGEARAVASSADVTGPDETVCFFLTSGPTASATAKRALLADDGFLPESVREDVIQLVTELVTNAVRHANGAASPPMRVELRRWADMVRIEIFGEREDLTAAAPDVVLVDRIADRWAIAPTMSGTCAWFEIRTGDERAATSGQPTRPGRRFRRGSVLKQATALLWGR